MFTNIYFNCNLLHQIDTFWNRHIQNGHNPKQTQSPTDTIPDSTILYGHDPKQLGYLHSKTEESSSGSEESFAGNDYVHAECELSKKINIIIQMCGQSPIAMHSKPAHHKQTIVKSKLKFSPTQKKQTY